MLRSSLECRNEIPLIEDRRVDHPVTIMCDVLGVSPDSAFPRWGAVMILDSFRTDVARYRIRSAASRIDRPGGSLAKDDRAGF